MRKLKVLVAVEPVSLSRVIAHLIRDDSTLQIVSSLHKASELPRQARRLRPDLIIANARLLGEKASDSIPRVKRASPKSKLLLTDFHDGLERVARQCGADAYLEEESLVARLVPTVRRLAVRSPRRARS